MDEELPVGTGSGPKIEEFDTGILDASFKSQYIYIIVENILLFTLFIMIFIHNVSNIISDNMNVKTTTT